MKKYNKPEIIIENVNMEDILAISVANDAADFDFGNNDLWFDWE